MSDKSDVAIVFDIVKELGSLWREMKACEVVDTPTVEKPQCVIFAKTHYTRAKAIDVCSKCDLSIATIRETDTHIYAEQSPKDLNRSYTCIDAGDGIQLLVTA